MFHKGLVSVVVGFASLRTSLQQGLDLLARQLLGGVVVVHVMVRQLVPQPQYDEDGQLHDRDPTEHRGAVLFELRPLGLLQGREVAVVDLRVVVVCHVVVLSEEVVFTVDDGGRVNERNRLSAGIELDEAVEADVNKGEEEGHAHQWLDVEPEQEGEATGDGKDTCGHTPIDTDPVLKPLRHDVLIVRVEVDDRRVPSHVQKHPVYIHHVVRQRGAVEVPQVEGVSNGPIQSMVNEIMRRGEVVWHVAKHHPDPVLHEVADRVSNPLLVHPTIMPLLYNTSG